MRHAVLGMVIGIAAGTLIPPRSLHASGGDAPDLVLLLDNWCKCEQLVHDGAGGPATGMECGVCTHEGSPTYCIKIVMGDDPNSPSERGECEVYNCGDYPCKLPDQDVEVFDSACGEDCCSGLWNVYNERSKLKGSFAPGTDGHVSYGHLIFNEDCNDGSIYRVWVKCDTTVACDYVFYGSCYDCLLNQ